MSRMASSSSRASLSGQNSAPCSTMASAEAGGAACGPRKVMVASWEGRSNSTEIVLYSTASAERSRVSGLSAMPLAPAGRCDLAPDSPRPLPYRLPKLGGRPPFLDGPPVHGALAFDALLGGAEHVGAIAAHLAFVGDAGESAGAGEHGEQRQLRQRHRRGAVVDQHDMVGRERQLVAAA